MSLRSLTDSSGLTVNGVRLGEPFIDGEWFVWDHELLPDGVIDADGTITTDTPSDPTD